MKLAALAHSRTGDKGNISNISLIVFDKKDYPLVSAQVTTERVQALFHDIVKGRIERFELPQLGALNFVLYDALAGGVTESTALDKHGKCLSSYLLDMEINEDA